MRSQLFFRIIYSPKINYLIRNMSKFLKPILPIHLMIPPVGVIRFDVNGRRVKFAVNQTSFFGTIIFWLKYRKFEYTDIFCDLINEIDCFFDIGANIGYYSLLAASINPRITVKSFEPSTGPLFYLRKNIALNRFQNLITAESIALSDYNGEIDFYEMKTGKYKYPGFDFDLSGEGNTGSLTEERNFVIIKVDTLTLDEYFHQHQNLKIDLIKIDTEGTEHLILRKSHEILKTMKPIIICETLFNKIESELEEIMLEFGYEFYNHVHEGLKQVSTIKRNEDNNVRNCFFVHPSKKDLIKKFIV